MIMRLHVGIAIFAFLLAGLITASDPNVTSADPSSSTPTAESTPVTVPKSTSKPTGATDTSTKAAVTTTTAAASSTTPAPASTTTPAHASPTTPTPPTSTTEKPTDVGTWNVTCIIAKMEVEFVYHNSSFNHILSPHAKDDESKCGDETQLLVLEDGLYKLSFTFFNDTNNIYVRNISATYPNLTQTETEDTSGKFFAVSLKKSFKCDSQEEVKFKDLTLKFTKVQVQGFVADGKFDEADKCDADITLNDFVPIAVACVLAAMVIIILISYLVFRRQSRQRGYQSV